jgi:hypothetical protein
LTQQHHELVLSNDAHVVENASWDLSLPYQVTVSEYKVLRNDTSS